MFLSQQSSLVTTCFVCLSRRPFMPDCLSGMLSFSCSIFHFRHTWSRVLSSITVWVASKESWFHLLIFIACELGSLRFFVSSIMELFVYIHSKPARHGKVYSAKIFFFFSSPRMEQWKSSIMAFVWICFTCLCSLTGYWDLKSKNIPGHFHWVRMGFVSTKNCQSCRKIIYYILIPSVFLIYF